MMTDTGLQISRATSQLALAHELGHSFGARHDPLEGVCQGYLMKPTSLNGSQRTHYTFSPCSLRQIAHTIKLKGYCLDEFEHPYCGNGLVEEGEECDCGLVVDCLTRDPCCIARGGRSHACLVNREAGHECHPSQGPCCLPNCRNRDLAHLGLNCSEENRGCPCTGDSTCSCGLLGRCLSGACHNIECTRLGLKECPCKYPENHCGTCCLSHEGTCIPAIHLTEPVIRSGNVSLISLRQPPSTAPPYSIRTVKVCHFTNCLNVSFRIWEKGGFCVHLGKLGVCSKDGLCDVSRPVGSTFPDFSTSDRLMSVNVGVLKQIGNKCLSI
uniref:Uncharacterized protein n=1 Tax=Timema cristinae TaxID=61476 RepID=A0A7R9CDY2_TIMCR|nr:unnamed protein product [Timema cristinae]